MRSIHFCLLHNARQFTHQSTYKMVLIIFMNTACTRDHSAVECICSFLCFCFFLWLSEDSIFCDMELLSVQHFKSMLSWPVIWKGKAVWRKGREGEAECQNSLCTSVSTLAISASLAVKLTHYIKLGSCPHLMLRLHAVLIHWNMSSFNLYSNQLSIFLWLWQLLPQLCPIRWFLLHVTASHCGEKRSVIKQFQWVQFWYVK